MKFLNNEITFSWFKENIGMIVLVPTFIGGIWQIMELAWLDTSYVRFFSLSQLASDGLLILFVFLICSVAARLIYSLNTDLFRKLLFNKSPYLHENPEELADKPFVFKEEDLDKGYKNFSWFLLIFMVFGGIFLVYPFNLEPLQQLLQKGSIIKPSSIILITMFFASVFIYFNGLAMCILTILELKVNVHNKKFRKVLSTTLRIILPALCLTLIIKLPILFHSVYLMPENLENKATILDRVKLNHPDLKSSKIQYFNDKFVFVSIIDSTGKETIEVLQFEAMFSHD